MTPAMISECERHIGTTPGVSIPFHFPGGDIPSTDTLYATVAVIASEDTVPVGIGRSAKKRNVGVIQVTVFGPRGEGAGPTGTIAMAIWRHATREQIEVPGEGWVTLKEGSIKDMDKLGEQHVQVVRVPYYYDFQK